MVNFKAIFQNTINFRSKKPDNAELVSRAKQYSGEWSKELPYYRFYEYYHQTPSVKRNINSIHKRWMGSKIEVQSQSDEFNRLWNLWNEVAGFIPKLKEFALDTLITGTGMFEMQYYQSLLANIEHIPTKTLWRIYRDEFGNILSIWQMVDGDIKEHAPRTMCIFTINNPERDAVGKSEMYAVAVPQKVAGKVDALGNPINPERYLPSILDVKTRLNFAHMEIAEKQAKSRFFVSLKNIKDKDRQREIERDLENESSSKFITVTDADVSVNGIDFKPQVGSERFLDDVDKQIGQATGFPEKVIDNGGDMGYASGAIPMQDLGQKIEDMQNDLSSFVENYIFKVLCDQWNLDYVQVQPKLVFSTFVEKMNVEQLTNLLKTPNLPLAPLEQRSALKEFIPGMDDKLWEDYEQEQKKRQEEMMAQQTQGPQEQKNPRPEIEKDAEKPGIGREALHPLMTNPTEFEKYVKGIVEKKAKEYGLTYFALPPIDGEPYDAPNPEITNEDTMKRIKQMLSDVKSGKLSETDLKKEIESLSKEIDNVQYWIHELKSKHPEWKHDQVVAVAIKKSKESQPTPHQFKPNPAYPTVCQFCSLSEPDIIHSVPKKPRKKKDDPA